MAEKISINIDLSHSRQVNNQEDRVSHDISQQLKKVKPAIEYKYRFDRIFILTVFVLILLISLYLIFAYNKVASSPELGKPTVKQRHLSIPVNETIAPPSRAIFLSYETINVLDSFYFPIQRRQSTEHSTEESKELIKEQSPTKPVPNSQEKIVEIQADIHEIDSIDRQISEAAIKQSNTIDTDDKKESSEFIQINSKNLSRVLLVNGIYNKEPVNELSYFVNGNKEKATKVYLFTQINNSAGNIIEHQWWYQGNMVSNKQFTILGNRWRCYSSKNIDYLQQGKWLAKVVDQNGNILSTVNFQYNSN